jgi:hypothetical protein
MILVLRNQQNDEIMQTESREVIFRAWGGRARVTGEAWPEESL